MTCQLVLIRHGQSEWNRQNRFTGWEDVDLTQQGKIEAQQAGCLLKEAGLSFDIAFTSVLKRAIRTLWFVLSEMDLMYLPVNIDWRLNERHYGALQGLNKAETAKKYGEAQIKIWRRSFDTPPPLLPKTDVLSSAHNDPRYANLNPEQLPCGESLALTIKRVIPCWQEMIVPTLRTGKRPLVVAHGNSIRALIKELDSISDEDIVNVEIPTGVPIVYTLDNDLKPIRSQYLGDPDKIAAMKQAVANQGKAI